jgi:hypothetical protein
MNTIVFSIPPSFDVLSELCEDKTLAGEATPFFAHHNVAKV